MKNSMAPSGIEPATFRRASVTMKEYGNFVEIWWRHNKR